MARPKLGRSAQLLAVGAVLGVIVLASARPRSRRRPPDPPVPPLDDGPFQWVDADAPRRIRQLSSAVEAAAAWPRLGDFLSGVAYIESRGNPSAGSSADSNEARGWFGMRPKSAKLADLGLTVSALKDEPTAVALAGWYGHRCRTYAGPGQTITWLALRRCWGLPSDTSKVDHPGYRAQLKKGLKAAGVEPALMDEPAFPPGYSWPGIDVVLDAVGR